MSISGYSHKQQVLLEKILELMFNFEFDPKRFEIIKEQLLRSLKNFKAEQPYQHAVYYLALILTEHAWTKQELTDAVSCNFTLLISNPNLNFFFSNSNNGGTTSTIHKRFFIPHACRMFCTW